MANWYPEDREELSKLIDSYFKEESGLKINRINGLIVPHASYEYSGKIAGKAFSLLNDKKIEKAVILGPSHYMHLKIAITSDKFEWTTSLGKIKLFNKGFPTMDIEQEHSIKNQIPFLQKLGVKEIMPLMIGEISSEEAKAIAEKIKDLDALFVFSTDLSHFLDYAMANKVDKSTIKIIENIDIDNFENIDACGAYPLLILFHLCRIINAKPHLIEYKNSGDVTGDKSAVVGYAGFWL